MNPDPPTFDVAETCDDRNFATTDADNPSHFSWGGGKNCITTEAENSSHSFARVDDVTTATI